LDVDCDTLKNDLEGTFIGEAESVKFSFEVNQGGLDQLVSGWDRSLNGYLTVRGGFGG